MSNRPLIFISYNHRDEIWKDLLLAHLGSLSREFDVEFWDDRRIVAGDDWKDEISIAINNASIALLLLSADYLVSEYLLQQEIPFLFERQSKAGLIVIPIIIRPCDWASIGWLAQIQALPRDGKPLATLDKSEADIELSKIANEIREIIGHVGFQERGSRQEPTEAEPHNGNNEATEEASLDDGEGVSAETASTVTSELPEVEKSDERIESKDHEALATEKRESTYLKKLERDVADLEREIIGLTAEIAKVPQDERQALQIELGRKSRQRAQLSAEIPKLKDAVSSVNDAIDALGSSIVETNRAITKNGRYSFLFVTLGLSSYVAALVYAVVLGPSITDITDYLRLFPCIILFLMGTSFFRHDKKIRDDYIHLSDQKHALEKTTGLLRASSFLSEVKPLDPLIESTFVEMRNRLLLQSGDSSVQAKEKSEEIPKGVIGEMVKAIIKGATKP